MKIAGFKPTSGPLRMVSIAKAQILLSGKIGKILSFSELCSRMDSVRFIIGIPYPHHFWALSNRTRPLLVFIGRMSFYLVF